MSQSSSFRKVRAGVVATSFAAVIFLGATYGAGLKTQQEWKEKRSEFRTSPLQEQIAILETQRDHLAAQRETLREKMRNFDLQVRERKIRKEKEDAERRAQSDREAAEKERREAVKVAQKEKDRAEKEKWDSNAI